MTTDLATRDGARVGSMLRTWRTRRRLSQLDLAALADVSTRHLSFVENGRSRPTADMILRLAGHLDVPLREQDRLLLAGGYAPRFDRQELDPGSTEVVMAGLRDLLDAHLPYPALLLDSWWDVVDANAAAQALMATCDVDLLEPPVNALRLSLHPRGLAPRIRNLDAWAGHLVRQVTSRAQHTHDPRLDQLAAELRDLAPSAAAAALHHGPVLALELETDDGVLRFFTVAAQLETASDSLLEGLHLETFVPADQATRAALQR
ncbi:MAG: family transcriptional regulator [Nocardioides sp.]|nr:family transcriptional regulator [Nocardioides sp.]